MRLSSKLVPRAVLARACVAGSCLAGAGLDLALIEPGQAAVAARSGAAVVHVAPAARAMPQPARGVRAEDFHGRERFAGRRHWRGDGDAGLALGLAAYGLDAGDGYGAPPPEAGGYGPPPMLPPPVLLPLPACPLVIKIGRGLDHPVKTQVVYGRPVCRP